MSRSRRVSTKDPPHGDAPGPRYPSVFRSGLAVLSAVLLIGSLPSPDMGWLGWVALVPLLIAIHGLQPLSAARLGLVTGIVASFGIYGWLFEVPSFDLRHAVLLALYVGIYPATWAAATAWLTGRDVPLLIAAPVLWVIVDYLRAHAGFLALPWGTLAQTQHRNLALLQVASLLGEHGVTFLVAMGNAALALLIQRRERQAAVVAGIVLAAAHLWGAATLSFVSPAPSVTIAAIQPNIQIAERKTEEGRRVNLERLEALTHAAAAQGPALIVWPESAIPGDLADPSLVSRVQALSDQIGIPLILGAAEVEKFAIGEGPLTIGRHAFNTAHLFRPGEAPAPPYRKRVLVPFAEYRPHPDVIPWPEWLAPQVVELTPGEHAQLFRVGPVLAVGTLICWENLFAPLARESVDGGANLLVQLTNDVWFGRSAAPWQHNLMSVMRAVENRTPIVIASNTGPSQLIDAYGRVVAGTGTVFSAGFATGSAQLGGGGTFYSEVGDLVLLMLFLPFGLRELWQWMNACARPVPKESSPQQSTPDASAV